MKILKNDRVLVIDVDQTLILWDKKHHVPDHNKIKIIDPLSLETLYLTPHKVHIRLLKQHKARGYYVIVWSKASYHWANAVVEALDLTDYVDLVMSKPEKHIDDCENVIDILGPRVYLENEDLD
jgi:hydroxymethylpyrimidine pyrophosphatase-like HAD family hydrolase